MSKGVINSITLDKSVILKDESAKVTVDYTASGSGVFTLDDFVDQPSYLQTISNVWGQQAKLTASDANNSDAFGDSVAIDGDYAIVGAYGNDDDGSKSGSAYIFKRDGSSWEQKAKLTASDGEADDRFGISVAISGDYAIVGAFWDGDYVASAMQEKAGSAYIFKKDNGAETWILHQKLTASDAATNDYFGYSVAISGDYAIVGAYKDDDNGTDSGSAYIFKRVDSSHSVPWEQKAKLKLTASDAAVNDYFGNSVAISGDYVIVGAYAAETDEKGEAYIFKKDNGAETWTQKAKLTASDAGADDYFGNSVAISGDYVIVGARLNDGDNNTNNTKSNSGSAYIFKKDNSAETWTQKAKLTASDEAIDDYFGASVAISGDYAIVGAYGVDVNNTQTAGAAYIFKRNDSNWTEQHKLTLGNDAATNDYFAFSVAISGDYAIVGAYAAGTDEIGAAYIYQAAIPSFALDPSGDTVSFKKLEIKTNNWSGITESNYFLINTYSSQDSGIMNTAYNEYTRIKNESYSLGSGYGYSTGSSDGYSTGYATGSGVGYPTGFTDGHAVGSGNGYTAGSGVGYPTGFTDGHAVGSGDGYTAGSGVGFNAGVESVIIRSITITVHEGWNIFNSVISGNITDSSNVIIAESLHRFNGTAYEKIPINNIIEASKGYMVKCEKSGVFTINLSEN